MQWWIWVLVVLPASSSLQFAREQSKAGLLARARAERYRAVQPAVPPGAHVPPVAPPAAPAAPPVAATVAPPAVPPAAAPAAATAAPAAPQLQCMPLAAWVARQAKAPQWSVYSQGSQDSVLDSLFSALGTTSKFFVEFGFNSPTWSPEQRAASGANTQYLKFRKGWNGLLLDAVRENPAINLHKAFLTEENMNAVFHQYGVPLDVDYVSIDIDSCDMQMLRTLLAHTEFKPKVITVEYNAVYTCQESKMNKCTIGEERYAWDGDNLYSASLLALTRLAQRHGYSLAWVVPRLDAVFVRTDLLCPNSIVPYEHFCPATGVATWHREATPADREKWIVDYP